MTIYFVGPSGTAGSGTGNAQGDFGFCAEASGAFRSLPVWAASSFAATAGGAAFDDAGDVSALSSGDADADAVVARCDASTKPC